MKHLRNSLVVFAVVLAITAVVTAVIPSSTKGQKSDVPKSAFSVYAGFRHQQSLFGPDPEGTSYAITSFTVANEEALPVIAEINVLRGATNDCLSSSSITRGPRVRVLPGETVHLSFPQPFVFSAESSASCLQLAGLPLDDFISVTVVGYKF